MINCIHIHTHAQTHAYTDAHTHTNTYIHTHTHTHVYTYTRIHRHAHTYIYTRKNTSINTQLYNNFNTQAQPICVRAYTRMSCAYITKKYDLICVRGRIAPCACVNVTGSHSLRKWNINIVLLFKKKVFFP